MIRVILDVTQQTLKITGEQLSKLEEFKETPYLLSDRVVMDFQKIITKEGQEVVFFMEMCQEWRNMQLPVSEMQQVKQIEEAINSLQLVHEQILFILDYCKDFTINKILQKDDLQLMQELEKNPTKVPDMEALHDMFKEFQSKANNDKTYI